MQRTGCDWNHEQERRHPVDGSLPGHHDGLHLCKCRRGDVDGHLPHDLCGQHPHLEGRLECRYVLDLICELSRNSSVTLWNRNDTFKSPMQCTFKGIWGGWSICDCRLLGWVCHHEIPGHFHRYKSTIWGTAYSVSHNQGRYLWKIAMLQTFFPVKILSHEIEVLLIASNLMYPLNLQSLTEFQSRG